MTTSLFPEYIQRTDAQKHIRESIEKVQSEEKSRAFILYGEGGRGKTVLQRNLPEILRDCTNVKWVGPIDLDNIQFWSPNNLKLYIADVLGGENFKTYQEFLEDYDKYENYEQWHGYNYDPKLREYQYKLEDEFQKAYKNYINQSKRTVVLQLDTVEAVRDFDVFADIIDWLKRLPGTLLLISGRPAKEGQDRVIVGLKDYPFDEKRLEVFTDQESQRYLEQSVIFSGLEENEIKKIILFVQGHPLWLALTVYYLDQVGLPQTLNRYPLDVLQTLAKDEPVFDEYVSELLTPYKDRTFWHEAILRLSILRQRMNYDVWKTIMEDIPLPVDVKDWGEAWRKFKELPWVRQRANNRYITLQDAFAEEMAKRYIPKVDKSGILRRKLWTEADKAYDELVEAQKKKLEEETEQQKSPEYEVLERAQSFFDTESPYFDLYLLQAAELHYKMLVDHEDGCQFFEGLVEDSLGRTQHQLAELLALEIRRFLPGQSLGVLDDVERQRLEEVQSWFEKNADNLFLIIDWLSEINLFLGRPEKSKKYLEERVIDWKNENKLIPYIEGLIWLYTATWRQDQEQGLTYLKDALNTAEKNTNTQKYIPHIQQLFGFSYRAAQQLEQASEWLEKAVKTSREQKNWEILGSAWNLLAYIYATIGAMEKARPMIRQALEIRQKLLDQVDENTPEYRARNIALGWSYNTLAEINRYRGKLAAAQTFYLKAGRIFDNERYYEGQAISLQAWSDTCRRIALAADRRKDQEQSIKYWKRAEEGILESFWLYNRYGLKRELETAHRRYGRFLHAKQKYDEAEDEFKKGLSQATEKNNVLEIIENIQELLFLSAEQGKKNEFRKWEKEINQYANKVWQWDVFPSVTKVARGWLHFVNGSYNDALQSYTEGYIELAKQDGYGRSLYEAHRDRVFNNIKELRKLDDKRKWLEHLKHSWENAGLKERHPDFMELCDLQLLTIELF